MLRPDHCGTKFSTMTQDLSRIRREYAQKTLSKTVVSADPSEQLKSWIDEAIHCKAGDSTAMSLATADSEGKPSARIVLLKEITEEGLIFYTNYHSTKGKQMDANPWAAVVFYWHELERQVRVEGSVEMTSEEKSDEYFQSRPESSKLGAWASDQSSAVPNRSYLENRLQELTEEFSDHPIPRPPHWGGYTIKPWRFEFWQGRENRLHDRIEYYLYDEGWKIQRLAP